MKMRCAWCGKRFKGGVIVPHTFHGIYLTVYFHHSYGLQDTCYLKWLKWLRRTP